MIELIFDLLGYVDKVVWGDSIVWGASEGDTIVWGQ